MPPSAKEALEQDDPDFETQREEPPEKAPVSRETPEEQHEEERASKTVPLAVMLEERNERKRLQNLLEEKSSHWSRLEERINTMLARSREEENPPPDPNTDPIGHTNYQLQRVGQVVQHTADQQEQIRRTLEGWQSEQGFQAQIASIETEYGQKVPDYRQAVQFLQTQRMAQYDAMGLSPEQKAKTLKAETVWLASNAMRNGKNPAEVAYNMAKSMGYKAAAPAPVKGMEVRNKLATVQKGLASKSSLSGAGGAVRDDLTMEDLRDMDDEEFDRATSGKNWKKFWV